MHPMKIFLYSTIGILEFSAAYAYIETFCEQQNLMYDSNTQDTGK